MHYVLNESLLEKFNHAMKNKNIIYFRAATGFGKTIFIRRALKGADYAYFSLKEHLDNVETDKKIVVIDDFQYIIDNKHLLKRITEYMEENRNVIISSRSRATHYFMIPNSVNGTLEILERDLLIKTDDLVDTYKDSGVDPKACEMLIENTGGCGLLLSSMFDRFISGEVITNKLTGFVASDFVDHIRNNVFEYMDKDVVKLLAALSVVDSFTNELANAVTLSDNVDYLCHKAMEYGNFLFYNEGTYTIRPIMNETLRKYASDYYNLNEYNLFRQRAAEYCEAHSMIPNTIDLYYKCGNKEKVLNILIDNSMKSPEEGYYIELEKYYDMLTEDDLLENPVLLSGLAMMECIRVNVDKSTGYYNRLKELYGDLDRKDKKLIKSQISYLDVALPQLGTSNIFTLIKGQVPLVNSGSVKIQPYSITSNLPTIINGGKDLTPYAKKYSENLKLYGHLVTFIMGKKNSSGLLAATEAEVMYEMGYGLKSLAALTKAQMESSRENYNIYFVGTRVEALLSLQMGNLAKAGEVVHKFIEHIKNDGKKELVENAYALKTLFNIYSKNTEYVKTWLTHTPDERKKFYTLNRYQYMVKALAYIYLKQYDDAILLLGKLEYYCEVYKRSYNMIQVKLLKSIIYYLTENEYITEFLEALKLAESLNLTSVISVFGSTVYEMVSINKKRIQDEINNDEWFEIVVRDLTNMNVRYPEFLNEMENVVPKLSEAGLQIIRLQSQGLSLQQIADDINMNLETVRYHAKQNYKKLGAQGKADAVIIAKKYKLI